MVQISPVQMTVWFLLCDRTQADTELEPGVGFESPWYTALLPAGLSAFRVQNETALDHCLLDASAFNEIPNLKASSLTLQFLPS